MAAERRVRWLRRGLLALFVFSLAGIVVLLRFGGSDDEEGTRSGQRPEDKGPTGDFQIRSTNQRQIVSLGDRILFELHADVYIVQRDEMVSMTGVTVRLERDEGTYVIKSGEGTYDQTRSEALLQGDVVVEGPQPFKLWADWLELKNQGQVIVASRGSRFELGASIEGTSEALTMDLENETVLMNDGVEMHSKKGVTPPFSLAAPLVRFEQAKRRIRAEGGAALTQGSSSLEALGIFVYLDEFEDRPEFVRALWEVKGTVRQQPGIRTAGANSTSSQIGAVDFAGMSLALVMSELGEPLEMRLDGTRREKVLLDSRSALGVNRRLQAAQIRGNFLRGQLDTVEAVGGVELTEVENGIGTPVRRGTSESATASFDQTGSVVRIDLEGDVILEDPRVRATAARARLSILQRMTELFGSPNVQTTSSEGVLTAPKIRYNEELGLLEASGGTRSRLDETQTKGAAVALGGGSGPVFVEAKDALFQRQGGDFLFKGDVRAWQGKNLLIADQLRGEENGAVLHASGHVRTVWYPEETTNGTADRGFGGKPVEVRSGFMTYQESDGNILYEEQVSVRSASGVMSCARLEAELSGENEIRTMNCSAAAPPRDRVSLIDEALGRKLYGDRMVYHPAQDDLEIFGRVEATEGARKFTGPYLLYDLETGSFSAGRRDQGATKSPPDF